MRMYDLIQKKKDNIELTQEEIEFIVKGYTEGNIPDYQMSAFLMSVCFNGMTNEETAHLTMSMARSGDMLDLGRINGIKVDKHSTGGVGDKTSLVLAPMVAALGVPVAKLSGRGLGHTGGTIDKLEAIKGFNTSIPIDTFINNVNTIKIAIAGQTACIAPADKKIYGLRDVTATVNSMPLIASSIMSKKIASGADVIVLDVKTGCGAFMKTEENALELAKTMVELGKIVGRKTYAIISDMNQPLGFAVGNALELIEAINTLKGQGPEDLLELCLELGAYMLIGAEFAKNVEEAKLLLQKTIEDGSAYKKLLEFVSYQGGDIEQLEDISKLPTAKFVQPILSMSSGYVKAINTEGIGILAMRLGGGRETKESIIDLAVGFVLNKKLGDYVENNEVLATIYANDIIKMEEISKEFIECYTISQESIPKIKLIKETVR